MWLKEDFVFENDLVVICEGPADKAFLKKLAIVRGLPHFDCPWPADRDVDSEAPIKAFNLAGKDKFGVVLDALEGQIIQNPEEKKIKGVVFVADAGDDPSQTFRSLADKIRQVKKWGVPDNPYTVKQSSSGIPSVAIILVPPDNQPGGLETLCVDFFREKRPEIFGCMEAYLKCGSISVATWNAEKQAKAKFQCLIAATNKDDPNKSLRHIFTSQSQGIIDLRASCFDAIAQKFKEIAEDLLGAAGTRQ
jgi:hypothetical protein